MNRRALRVAVLVVAAGATFVSSLAWSRGYAGGELIPLLAGAVLIAYVVPWIAAMLERSVLASALSSAILAVAFCLIAVEHDARAVDGIGRGLIDGPARLLSVTLPAHGPRWLLVTPVLITWLAAAIAGEATARTESVAVPVATGFALFVSAYALTAARAVGLTTLAVATVALWGGWAAARRALTRAEHIDTHESDAAPRALAVASVVGVVLASTAGAVATALPRFDAAPAAPHREVPIGQVDPVLPLSGIATLRAGARTAPTVPLFSISISAPVAGYVAVAELDTYDGGEWRLTRTFAPSGGSLPALDDTGPTLRAHVDVVDPRGLPWMLYVPAARSVDGVDVAFDPATRMLVPTRPLRAGDAYTVQSAAAATTLEGLPHSDVPLPIHSVTDYNDVAIPPTLGADVDKVVTDFETETRVKADDPVAFLTAVATDLRSARYRRIDRPEDVAAPRRAPASTVPAEVGQIPGIAFSSVVDAVTNRRAGTPEQYATLFAMIARRLSVPARVVTGFRVDAVDAHGTVAPGRYDLRASDAWTWVELGIGSQWTPSDPTPNNANPPHVTTTTLPAGAGSGVTTTTAAALAPDAADAPSVPLADPVRRSHHDHNGWWRALLLAASASAVAIPVFTRARRWHTRRQRRRGDARARVAGAWHEALDTLERARLGDTGALTVEEVAANAGARFGVNTSELVAAIGTDANVALYSSVSIDDATAKHAWERVARLRSHLRGRIRSSSVRRDGRARRTPTPRASHRSTTTPGSTAST